ncbi:MAG: hypothetical protein ACHQZQ_07275 [SAR324 cluster bacterium]
MTRATGILALLWVAALAWAFALTQPDWWPAGQADRPIALWTLDAQDFRRIEYSQGASHVALTFDPAVRLADGSPESWLEAEGPAADAETPPKPAAPKGGALQPAGKPGSARRPEAPPVTSAGKPEAPAKIGFRGGLAAARLVRELAHLSALRELGRVDQKRLTAFGLAPPLATLRLERAGGDALILDLGIAPFGAGTRYALLRSTGRAYVLNQGMLGGFDHPRRMMDREWAPFSVADAKRIDAKLGGRTLTVWQLDLPRTETQRWARSANAAKGEPDALRWVQALMGVKVLDYLAPAHQPARSEVMLEVVVTPAGGNPAAPASALPAGPLSTAPVTLRVFKSAASSRRGPAEPAASANAAGRTLRAASGYTGSPVELSAPAVQSVIDQARALLGVQ